MANVGAAIKSQIELELNAPKLKQQLQWLSAAIEVNAKGAKRALSQNITAEIIAIERRAREMERVLRSAYKAAQPPKPPPTMRQRLGDFFDRHEGKFATAGRIGQDIGRGAMRIGAVTAGLTFGAAAAAGSTTLDTLTGSIRMLTLEVGSRAQPAIIGLSRWIQRAAKSAKDLPEGAVGGGAGALLGGAVVGILGRALTGAFFGSRFGPAGLVGGAILGGVGGMVAGSRTEKALARDERIEQMARAFVIGGEKVANAAHVGVGQYFKRVKAGEIKPTDENQRAIDEIQHALRRAEDPEFRKRKDEFLTAGLDMPASFTDLADLRRQAQLAVFDKGGALGAANAIKELENNMNVFSGKQVDLLGMIEKNTRKDNPGDQQANVRPAQAG